MVTNFLDSAIDNDPDVHVILSHGGTEEIVDMSGLSPGFGLFTLLDTADPLNPEVDQGLVRLSDIEGFYDFPTNFVEESRLFGQGAEIIIKDIQVTVTE